MKKILLTSVALGYSLLFTGCIPDEPEPQFVTDFKKQIMQNLKNGDYYKDIQVGTNSEEKVKKEVSLQVISQEELNKKIAAFGIAQKSVNFVATQAGFSINGTEYVDYEGSIKQASFNHTNGYATILVETSPDSYLLKFIQATSKEEPLTIAKVEFDNGMWKVTTVTGKKLNGHNFQVGSNGFIITRAEGTGFFFENNKGVSQINIPQGYQVAKFQNGDVVGSQTILLEIPEIVEEEGSLSSIFSKAKALGSMLGVTKKQDYAFLNLNSNKVTKINIPNDGKSTLQCLEYGERINKFVVKCLKYADPVESLYKNGGEKNFSHYYWRVKWFNTASGVIALTQEDDLGKIYGTNLSTGKKVLLKRYLPGYNEFDANIQSNGKLTLSAKKGMFGSDDSEDVEAEIEKLEAIVEKE